jgi:hypothetical protein
MGSILYFFCLWASKKAEAHQGRNSKSPCDEPEKKVKELTAERELRNEELQDFISLAAHDLQESLRKI